MTKKIFILIFLVFISINIALAQEIKKFTVDKTYDIFSRENLEGYKIIDENTINIYIEKDYYDKLSLQEKANLEKNLKELSDFYKNIFYEKINQMFSFLLPEIDVFFSQIKEKYGGYFNYAYPRVININVKYADNLFETKRFLVHELGHILSYYLKEKNIHKIDEVWISELKAEWFVRLFGLSQDYSQFITSILEDSLREWLDEKKDYAFINFSIDFIEKRFGTEFLKKLYTTKKIGIQSFTETLSSLSSNLKFEDVIVQFFDELFSKYNKIPNKSIYIFGNTIISNKINLKDTQPYLLSIKISPGKNYLFKIDNYPENKLELFILKKTKKEKKFLKIDKKGFEDIIDSDSSIIFTIIEKQNITFKNKLKDYSIEFSIKPYEAKTQNLKKENYKISKNYGYVGEDNIFYIDGDVKNLGNLYFKNTSSYIEILKRTPDYLKIKISEVYKLGDLILADSLTNTYIGEITFLPNLKDGTLISPENGDEIYVIKAPYKRKIDKNILKFYGHLKNARIIKLPKSMIDLYKDSNLIIKDKDYKVYEVIDHKKYWIETEEKLFNKGYNFDMIFKVNDLEFNYYK